MTHLGLFAFQLGGFYSLPGLPVPHLHLRLSLGGDTGCSGPLDSSREGLPTTQTTQFPKRGLCPVSSRAELEPSGRLSACNPNSRQGPLASNKPSRLQKQAQEYSPGQIMINWQRGGPGGHSDNEKVSPSYLKCRGPGEGPWLAPDSWQMLPAPSRACSLQRPNTAPPHGNRGTDVTNPGTRALEKSTVRTPTGASSRRQLFPKPATDKPCQEEGGLVPLSLLLGQS